MGVFARLWKAVRNLFGKTNVETAYGINIAVSSKMEEAIELWTEMFEDRPPWKDPEKGQFTTNTPAAIATEAARLVTIEMKSEATGSPRADFINEQYQPVIEKARNFTEYACAKGGIVLKPYVVDDKVAVSIVQPEDFYPESFDSNGDVTAAVFTDYRYIGNKKYTRLEYHKLEGGTLTIRNKVYCIEVNELTKANASAIGNEVPLASVPDWEGIEPEVTIEQVEKSLFAYFKMPFANSIDVMSPLGVSIFSRAVDQIAAADRQWSEILWEYDAGEAAIHASSTLFKKRADGTSVLPEGRERLFRTFDFDRDQKLDAYTPAFRDGSLFNGLNKYLQRIEFLCGLAYGTISEPAEVDRSATEVKQSRQRSFATVSDIQKALQKALEHLIYAIDTLATLYDLAPAGEYETTFEWDDSIIVDREVEFTRLMTMAAANMIRPEYVTAWYFGMNEEEAKKMLPDAMPDNEVFVEEEE